MLSYNWVKDTEDLCECWQCLFINANYSQATAILAIFCKLHHQKHTGQYVPNERAELEGPTYPWPPFFDQNDRDKEAAHPCSVQETFGPFQHCSQWKGGGGLLRDVQHVTYWSLERGTKMSAGRQWGRGSGSCVESWTWSWHTLVDTLTNSHASGQRNISDNSIAQRED